MINHVRTLLLNRRPDRVPHGGLPGDEYLPVDYTPARQPGWMAAIRTVLLGASPDRLMGNYRIRQLLACLHDTELRSHLVDDDPRITYEVHRDDLLSPRLYGVLAPAAIATGGSGPSPDTTGVTTLAWRGAVSGDRLVLTGVSGGATPGSVPLDMSEGLSAVLPLPGTSCWLRLADPLPSSLWITVRTRPRLGVGDLAATLRGVAGEHLTSLFGVGGRGGESEPMRTWRRLWEEHPETDMAMGGLLLALARRTQEARNA